MILNSLEFRNNSAQEAAEKWEETKKKIKQEARKAKVRYDKDIKIPSFKNGDLVRVLNPAIKVGKKKKLRGYMNGGPFVFRQHPHRRKRASRFWKLNTKSCPCKSLKVSRGRKKTV